ncbi:MAG: tyrosine-type recombinase/integrase [Myxococcota bacterium]|nr:tyrosine-type recombinase/integrase [Myxococcota bacterium]
MSKPVKLPSGKWRIRYVTADGKRESVTVATFDLARTELRRLEVGADETRARRQRDPALAMTVAEAYARHKVTDAAAGGTDRRFARKWKRIEQHYRDHIEPHLAAVLLADLTPSRLKAWINVLAETSTGRHGEKNEAGRKLSAGSIRAVVVTLRQIAKASDVPLQVLLPGAMKQRARRSRPKAFQCIEDVRAFMAACRDPWFKVAAALACYAGARLGEAASVRWRHIGQVGKLATLTIAASWEGPLKARYETGDEAARVVPLHPELAAILAAWRKETRGGDDDLVVLVNGKRPLCEKTDTDMARRTRRACKRAGVTELAFHELRASYATIAANLGVPLALLQAALGHADIATTAIYVRPESAHAALDPRLLLGGHEMATPQNQDSVNLN